MQDRMPQVHAYDGVTGSHILRLPYTSAKWSDTLNDAGSLSIDVDYTDQAMQEGLRSRMRPWLTILALQDDAGIRHAGYLTNVSWDAKARRLSLTCGGGMTILQRRLVLDHRLDAGWVDREVIADEQHPPELMCLHLEGSYPDIIRGLVDETMQWGRLPITLPAREGGTLYRNYFAWDMAYVYDRIQDITQLQYGPDVRFDPIQDDNGSMHFKLTSARGIVDRTWRWDSSLPRVRVIPESDELSGTDMTTQVYTVGGRGEDKTVMARRYITPPGGMLLQCADTTHTTDGDIRSLQGYARARLSRDAWARQSLKLQVGDEYRVHVGDHVDLRPDDDYLGMDWLHLSVTGVDGDTGSDWLSLQCTER